jgi:hypothetical protein
MAAATPYARPIKILSHAPNGAVVFRYVACHSHPLLMNFQAMPTLKLFCRGWSAVGRASQAAGSEVQYVVTGLGEFECGYERHEQSSLCCLQFIARIFVFVIVTIFKGISFKCNSACVDRRPSIPAAPKRSMLHEASQSLRSNIRHVLALWRRPHIQRHQKRRGPMA